MALEFLIKQNDTLPALVATLTSNGNPVDLTAAVAVNLIVRQAGQTGVALFKKPCVVSAPASGIVTYNWDATDTETNGTFDGEFEVEWPTGLQTFPHNGYFKVVVYDDLG